MDRTEANMDRMDQIPLAIVHHYQGERHVVVNERLQEGAATGSIIWQETRLLNRGIVIREDLTDATTDPEGVFREDLVSIPRRRIQVIGPDGVAVEVYRNLDDVEDSYGVWAPKKAIFPEIDRLIGLNPVA